MTYAVPQNDPLGILVSRVRGGSTNTFEMSEPGSRLDAADRPHYLVGIRTPESSLSASDLPHYFNIEPAPRFTDYASTTNGSFLLHFTGVTNGSYRVWGSTNLSAWQDLGPATQGTPGRFEFLDPGASNCLQRFYRVRKP